MRVLFNETSRSGGGWRALVLAGLCLSGAGSSVPAQLFSDNFTRGADPVGLTTPWATNSGLPGAWTVTGGELRGGPNVFSMNYGFAYVATNSWTNYSVSAKFRFSATDVYGGGLGGRLNAASGAHYAAWLYPEASTAGLSNVVKLFRFSAWNSFTPIAADVSVPNVGTTNHTLKLEFLGSQIGVYYDGLLLTNVTDATYASGGISIDMWSDPAGFSLFVDDVVVNPVVNVPVANNDSYNIVSGLPLSVTVPGVLGNDVGGVGPLSAVLVSTPTKGNFSFNTNGSFTYTATNNYLGPDSFTYRASDGVTNSGVATVSINVTANTPPVASADSFTVPANVTSAMAAPGVLANDTDVNGNDLTAVLVANPTNGTVTLRADGGFSYKPNTNYTGRDVFTYRANDGSTNSATTTATLTVTPGGILLSNNFNSGSLAAPWQTNSGTWAVTNGGLRSGLNPTFSYAFAYVSTNWTDYSVSAKVQFPEGAFGGGIGGRLNTNSGAHYALWVYPEGSTGGSNRVRVIKFSDWATYTQLDDVALTAVGTNAHTVELAFFGNRIGAYFDGVLRSSVTDAGGLASGGITADMWTDAAGYFYSADDVVVSPLLLGESFTMNQATTLTNVAPGVLANDTGVVGTNLTATLLSAPDHGNLNLTTNGGFTYTPTNNYVGDDNFSYSVSDGGTNLGSAAVNITVVSVNSAPVLPGQTNRTNKQGTLLTIINTAEDADEPPDTLSYTLVNPPSGAQITTNGVITWTPNGAQAPSTNTITTIVTDDGVPARSATNSFLVFVVSTNGSYFKQLFTENFDGVTAPALPAGWTSSSSGAQSNWVSQSSVTNTSPNAAFAPDPANVGTSDLVSPAIVLPAGEPRLTFRHNYNFEAGFDGGVLEIKIGGGAFTDVITAGGVFITGGYTHTISNGFSSAIAGRLAWSGVSGGFITTAVDLPLTAAGQTIQLRWRAASDNGTGAAGWYVDSIALTNYFCCVLNTPVLPAPTNRTIAELIFLTVTNTATDADLPNDELTYALTAPTGAAISTNGVITWSPLENQAPTTNTFTTIVTDIVGRRATNNFTVTVTEVNATPVLTAQTNRTIVELTTLSVTNTVTDPDAPTNTFAYSLLDFPSGATINTNTGVISWSPTEAQGPGTNTITSVVTDNGVPPLSATNSFTVTVTEVNTVPDLPAQANLTIGEFSSLTVTNTATDPDSPTNTLVYLLLASPTGAVLNPNTGIITWTPGELDGSSTNTFTTAVTDNGTPNLSATNTFNVIVTEVNETPVLSAQTNRTIAELTTLTVTNAATDSDVPTNTLTYALADFPAGATINTNTGVISWAPNEAQGPGTNEFTTIVSDGLASATNSFTVVVTEVNVAPVLPVQGDVTVAELTSLTVTNSASDGDEPANSLTYSLSGPTNAVISASGVITWTPNEAQGPGTNTFTTIVSDGTASVTNSFVVVVTEANVAPVLPVQGDVTVAELTSLTVTNSATDGDEPANPLTYSLSGPTNAVISASGVITWVPSEAQGPGTNTFTTIVSDGTASVTNSFVVVVTEANVAPVLPVQGDVTVAELTSLTVTNSATDGDEPANPLTYSLSGPTNAVISASGVISWTPNEAQGPGTNEFTTIVSDGLASATNSFTVIVTEANLAPVLPVQGDVTVAELTSLTVTNSASDGDEPANSLTYSLSGPTNAVISAGGVISWTPNEAQGPSTNTFTTIVSDGMASATNSFVVVVTEVNTVPVLPVPGDVTVAELTSLTVTNSASDGDEPANPLTYSLSGPTNAVISASGVISWTPNEAQGPGTNVLTTIVSDGLASATNSFTVVVTEANVAPVLPAQGDVTVAELTSLTVTNSASDGDEPANPLTYSLSGPTNAVISAGGVITWTPNEAQGPGTNEFTTIVSDGLASATNSFVVVVTEVNSVPVLPVPGDVTVAELTGLTVTNSASDGDEPANLLTYSLSGPTNAVISAAGVITWTPSEAQVPGTNEFTTIVSDGLASVTNSFTVVVTEVNVVPVLPVQADRTIAELTGLTVTNSATDGDEPANLLTYSMSGPTNAVISAGGVISWTPNEAQGPGTNVLTTIVSDGLASATNSFVVVVTEVNSVPVLPVPGDVTVAELTGLTVTNSASDGDEPANLLTYSMSGPTNAVISAGGVISWTPNEAQGPSTNTFTTIVSDGMASATNSFVVVVTEVNTVPVLPVPGDVTVAELTGLTVTNSASDGDEPANLLTYSLSGPTNAVISAAGVITWTPSEAQGPGTNVFTTIVSDGLASATNSFTVVVTEVNVAPVLAAQPNRTIGELTSLTVTNSATDGDEPANLLTYSLSGPTNAAISASGVISWTPNEAQGPSTNTFTTIVSDGLASATNSFVVVVTEANVAPLLPMQGDVTVAELTSLTVTNSATDGDEPANSLTYSLSGPTNAAISASGVISWTPNEAQGPGTNVFTTIVSDGLASATNSFVVVVTEANVAPVLPVQGDVTVAELTSLTVTNSATDGDEPANSLTYSLSGPTNAAISASGVISWTPNEAQGPGTNVFTTIVSDGLASATNSFVVVVTEVNVAPVLAAQPNRTIAELTSLTVTNSATDGDEPTNPLTYSLSGPTNAVISASGVISWTPNEAQGPSTNTFTTIVSDGVASATNSFNVIVTEVNVAPVLSAQPNRTIGELTSLTVTNSATDGDVPTNPLTYSLSGPTNAAISASGVISWTPNEAQGPSTNTFTTIVSDGLASATNSFVVVVTEANVAPLLPMQGDVTVAELTSLTVTNSATDGDEPANPLTYSLSGPTNAVISAGGVISWTPNEAQGPGTNTFTTIVSDGLASATNSFTVIVTEANLAPVANDDSYTTSDSTLTIAAPGVLGNDADGDLPANALQAVRVSGPSHGTLTLNTNGGFSYTPTGGFSGADSFTYRVNDGLNDSTVATVTLTVSNSFQFRITGLTLSNGVASLTWNSVVNNRYRVQFKNSLADTNWTNLPADATATSPSTTITDNATNAAQRFYRISLAPAAPVAPDITAIIRSNGVVTIRWDSVASTIYRVQYKNTLADVNWMDLPPDVTAAGPSSSVTDNAPNAAQRYYRVILAPTAVPEPDITAIIRSNGVVTVWWNSVAGMSYRVQYKNSLFDANWNHLPPDVTATGPSSSVTDNAPNAAQRYYQVILAPTTVPAPEILSVTRSGGVTTITWSAVVGRSYRLFYNASVADVIWNPLAPDVVAAGATASATDATGDGTRFYKVVLLP